MSTCIYIYRARENGNDSLSSALTKVCDRVEPDDEREEAFVRTAEALLWRSSSPMGLRRQALDRLREKFQAINPFKFIIYSEWAGADLPPVE